MIRLEGISKLDELLTLNSNIYDKYGFTKD